MLLELLAVALLHSAPDPAARGLDVFILAPDDAPSGGTIPISVVAYGFPEVTRLEPLQNAIIEAVWDPNDVGADLDPVRANTDKKGRATLNVAMPDGGPGALTLILSTRHGDHERTNLLEIHRVLDRNVRLFVGERSVVPGSTITAWVLVSQAASASPVPHAPIDIDLLEGGVVRWHRRTTTDGAGSATVRVPIPRTKEPSWTWELRATLIDPQKTGATGSITLSPREETPATPRLRASFAPDWVSAGGEAKFEITAFDAADRPLAQVPIRYWVGSQGARPKDDESFEKTARRALTDLDGHLQDRAQAPSTIPPQGAQLVLIARAEIEGHALKAENSLNIGEIKPEATLLPEGNLIIPGVPQRMLLRVTDSKYEGVKGRFRVRADGIDRTVDTDTFGEAELLWSVPKDVGASHPSGPCASTIAATVLIEPIDPNAKEGSRREKFERCVQVDRDNPYLLVAERPIARAGESIRLQVEGGAGKSFQVVAEGAHGTPPIALTLADGARGGELLLPDTAQGLVTISAVSAETDKKAGRTATSILVVPQILPRLTATVTGGRIVPGGEVEIEAVLTDDRGRPIQGAISAAVIDKRGGGHAGGLTALDTRQTLTSNLETGAGWLEREDLFLGGDRSQDAWRRASIARSIGAALEPQSDPAKDAHVRFEEAFATVVRSLEGAVFEASSDPDRLLDARRKNGHGYEFNPELFTLVTSAMDAPPITPGGEPIELLDLTALDRQVTFDQVARRVTRLKIFHILEQVRELVYSQRLLPDEIALREPGAILRRLLREGQISEGMMIDPWGNALGFVRANGPPLPFLSPIPGFRLRSAGPDGKLGNADDVVDPFDRVLTSGSPYARAVEEDRLVDARYEVVVGDETVALWKDLFEKYTGMALGDGGYGEGLGSIGAGGGGGGVGISMGSASGRGRLSYGVATAASVWIPPARTDEQGRVKIKVPLGDIETTWRVALVALPDRASPASTTVDVPVSLPLSVRVTAGASWVAGDRIAIEISARNRTPRAQAIDLKISPSGPLELVSANDRYREIKVAAGGAAAISVEARATKAGEARLEVIASSAGRQIDKLVHQFEVKPAATPVELWSASWVAKQKELSIDLENHLPLEPARVELEHGLDAVLRAALEGLNPDRLSNRAAEAHALEAAARVARWSLIHRGEHDVLTVFAKDRARLALGRAMGFGHGAENVWATSQRLTRWATLVGLEKATSGLEKPAECPPTFPDVEAEIAALEVEPMPEGRVVRACWDVVATHVMSVLGGREDPDLIARALLALAERPHRKVMASALADRLRNLTLVNEKALLVLPSRSASVRATRAIVAAALLRTAKLGDRPVKDVVPFLIELRAQQSSSGDLGSPEATRAAVIALLGADLAEEKATEVTIEAPNRDPLQLSILPGERQRYTLDRHTRSVEIKVEGGGVLARLVQVVLRPWTDPPESFSGPWIDAQWPDDARTKEKLVLRLVLRHDRAGSRHIEARIPLPPGVSLAEGVSGVRQAQGVLVLRTDVAASFTPVVLELPIRADLPGQMTIPEGEARYVGEEGEPAVIPARPWSVRSYRRRRE